MGHAESFPVCPVIPTISTPWRPRSGPAIAIPISRNPAMPQLIPRQSLIIAPNRQRQEFEAQAMEDLRASIEERGLMHPIVIRETPAGPVLVAGERRLKSIDDLWALGGTLRCDGMTIPEGQLPVVTLGQLSLLEAEEAELDENLRRKDLTWQEHAEATARLHNLRQAQADLTNVRLVAEAESRGEVPPKLETQSYANTAEEILGKSTGSAQDAIRKEILVAKHLGNPEVAKAKSADEAFKILKRQEEREKNIAHAAAIGTSFSASQHQLLQGDCLEFMSDPSNAARFDVILTDPPYGMGADSFGDGGNGRMANSEHHYDDSEESWLKLMSRWIPLTIAVTKPQSHLYVFCDIDKFHSLRSWLKAAGWYVFRTPLINHKQNSGRVPLPEHGPRRQYEIILYAFRGDKRVNQIYPDVISVAGDDNLTHGAQKPVALFSNLLSRSVRAGDEILDCFVGSGTIFPAANILKCRATGLELNPEYYSIAAKRLAGLIADEPALV